ncbi:hypothetical protein ACM66B_002901 [Microbotryomycetes sp. NB124-2]
MSTTMDTSGDDDSPWLDDDVYDHSAHNTRTHDAVVSQQEWTRLANKFTDAGYRDGITEGKNSRLQQGFDQGFGLAAPYARRVGILRGVATSLLNLMTSLSSSSSSSSAKMFGSIGSSSSSTSSSSKPGPAWVQATFNDNDNSNRDKTTIVAQLRNIVERLSKLDQTKVVPPDLEALEHAKSHAAETSTDITNAKVDNERERGRDEYLSLAMHDKKEMNELETLMGNLDSGKPALATTLEANSVEACQTDLARVLEACGLDATKILPN